MSQIQPFSKYMSSYSRTSSYSACKKQYCLGFYGIIVLSKRSILQVTQFSRMTELSKALEYLQSYSMIAGSSEPKATGGATPWSPCSRPLLTLIPKRYLESCKRVNQSSKFSLCIVFDNYLSEQSSNYMAHIDIVPYSM